MSRWNFIIAIAVTLWMGTPHCMPWVHTVHAAGMEHMSQNETGCPTDESEPEQHCACCVSCDVCLEKEQDVFSFVNSTGSNELVIISSSTSFMGLEDDGGCGCAANAHAAPLFEGAKTHAQVIAKRE